SHHGPELAARGQEAGRGDSTVTPEVRRVARGARAASDHRRPGRPTRLTGKYPQPRRGSEPLAGDVRKIWLAPGSGRLGEGDGDPGPELAAAPGDPPVTLAEEGGGPGRRRGSLAQDSLEIGAALTGPPGSGLWSRL